MNLGPEHDNTPFGTAPEAQDPALEAALREALRPELPPAGFRDRLMARVAAENQAGAATPDSAASVHSAKRGQLLHWPKSRVWVTGAVAAALVAGMLEGGFALQRLRAQERRVREATQQFQTSERITVRALAQAREQLQRAGVPLNNLD